MCVCVITSELSQERALIVDSPDLCFCYTQRDMHMFNVLSVRRRLFSRGQKSPSGEKQWLRGAVDWDGYGHLDWELRETKGS